MPLPTVLRHRLYRDQLADAILGAVVFPGGEAFGLIAPDHASQFVVGHGNRLAFCVHRSSCTEMALAMYGISVGDAFPALLIRRFLLIVVSWSAMALDRFSLKVTWTSLGYSLSANPPTTPAQ